MWLKFDCAAKQLENPIKRTKKSSKPPCALQVDLRPRRPQVCQEKFGESFCSIQEELPLEKIKFCLCRPQSTRQVLHLHLVAESVLTKSARSWSNIIFVKIFAQNRPSGIYVDIGLVSHHIHHSTLLLATFSKTTNRIILKILFRKKSTCGDHRPAPEQVLIMENVYDT